MIPRHELRPLYRRDTGWPEVRALVRARAAGRCECSGTCGGHRGRCEAPDRGRIVRHPLRRGAWRLASGDEPAIRVILACAHLDQDPRNHDPGNVAALCQRCHLLHDLRQHWATRRQTERRLRLDAGQLELPLGRAA